MIFKLGMFEEINRQPEFPKNVPSLVKNVSIIVGGKY